MDKTDHISDVQLNEYLDNASADLATIDAHLRACEECRARLASLEALFTELESLPDLPFNTNLAKHLFPIQLASRPPRWLALTISLQAAALVGLLFLAVPILSTMLPRVQLPSLTTTLIQLQTQWQTMLDTISTFHLPAFVSPSFPTVEVSTLLISLAGVSVLWILGNGFLLRNRS